MDFQCPICGHNEVGYEDCVCLPCAEAAREGPAIFIPVHTHCSPCGEYCGESNLGVFFYTEEDAKQYLDAHPNKKLGWGNGTHVFRLSAAPSRGPGEI